MITACVLPEPDQILRANVGRAWVVAPDNVIDYRRMAKVLI